MFGVKNYSVTEILNYISAWVTLLAAMLGLCMFLFDRASKKNQPLRAINKKKSFLAARLSARDIKKSLSLFHLEQKGGSESHFLVRAKSW